MPFTKFTKKLIETKLNDYCERRISVDARDQVRLTYKIIGYKVNLIETRPYHGDLTLSKEAPLAQYRLDEDTQKWSLISIQTRPYYYYPTIWKETPIAQFRFDRDTRKWSLFCIDSNDRWHLYDLIRPSMDFDDMLKALDNDKTGAFWG